MSYSSSIGEYAFASCIFTNFRVPPLITVIPEGVLRGCTSTFSVEMPKNVTRIEQGAFYECFCLRNVAFPPNEIIIDDIFIDEEEGEDDDEIGDETELRTDLQILFGNSYRIISSALEDRFNELPIHSSVYFQRIIRGHYNALLHQAMSWIQREVNKIVWG
jgi:hypothetical protein